MPWHISLVLLKALSFVLVLHYVAAHPLESSSSAPSCGQTLVRREWRSLSDGERSSYINAVLCLQKRRPANTDNKIAQSRFDEFQGYHIDATNDVHAVGQFLPWHRYFVAVYEKALREECSYTGAQPYWDWSIDADAEAQSAGAFFNSPIFDPKTGFGGNGAQATYPRCLKTGPFADLTLSYGPGRQSTKHCLTRGFDRSMIEFLTSSAVANTTAQTNFEDFRTELEGQPVAPGFKLHDSGHLVVGGELGNVYSSPGDPLFYVHHANLDRIWRQWQLSKPGRLWEISGRSTTDPPYEEVTLDYPLVMGSLGPTTPIRQVMDTLSNTSCYTYA
ncbi:hypothetical protein BJ165DRAFT_1601496 [Panaeolus papilionaceus]|nr:hypothetical protein BJ165DRAFT_1601496 [Panaeolus papilionaceus]